MSANPFPKRSGWSYPRLFLVAVLLFGAQLLAFSFLSEPYVIEPRVNVSRFEIIQVAPSGAETLEPLLSLLDPTVFVLPAEKGFSGTAWLRTEGFDYRNPAWTEQPLFLGLSTNQLLGDFFRRGLVEAPLRPFTSRAPEPIAPEFRVDGSFLRVMSPTVVAFRGDLSGDDLVRNVEWPTLEHPDVLLPTELNLKVDRRGRVFSVMLLRGSGLASADRRALELARQLVFDAMPPESAEAAGNNVSTLRQTRLIVRWQTRPPTPTPTLVPPA